MLQRRSISKTALPLALVALVALSSPPSQARAEKSPTHGLVLVGAVLSTGQALLWDGAAEEYTMVRLGQPVRGMAVKRLLADRVVLAGKGKIHEVPLTRAPFVLGRQQERRGDPAAILIAAPSPRTARAPLPEPPEAVPAPPAPAAASPAVARPAAARPATAATKAKPAPVTAKARPAPTAAKPASAPAATKPAPAAERPAPAATKPKPVAVSMPLVRAEVSDFFRRKVSYRAQFAAGGVDLKAVQSGTLLHRLGLRSGDQIVSVGGMPLKNADDAMDAYLALQSGHRVAIVLRRAGKRQVLQVKLV